MNINRACLVFCPLLFCIVISVSVQAQSNTNVLDRKIGSFSIVKADIHLALQRLAINYKIPIGLEEIPEKKEAKARLFFDIELADCTTRDVLTAVTEEDQRYKWTEQDGVINVAPVQTQDTFLEVLVPKFAVSNVNRKEVGSVLVDCPEVQKQIKKLGIAQRNYVSGILGTDEQLKRFSLDLHNITVRRILNETLKEGDGYYWLVKIYGSRYGGHDVFFMLVL